MRPILAVLKKNLMSVICGVIAIAAIVAVFWPMSGYFADLQTQVDARKGVYSQLTTLYRKQRTLPVLDPLSTNAEPLKGFPTAAVRERGKLAQTDIANESAQMLGIAKTLVTHKPLVENALPSGGTMDATFFLRSYQQIMSYPNIDPAQTQFSLPVAILHAGTPPTDIDVKTKQDELRDEITKEKTQTDSTGAAINGPQVEAMVEEAVQSVPDELRSAAALGNQMYIAPGAYQLNPNLTGVTPPSLVAMFNGQMGLWLLQDVFSAIASANADSKGGVPTSPVKHLLKIEYAQDPFSGTSNIDPSAAPPPPPDALHPARVLTASPTGHVSNGLYDVIPFNLRLIVDAQQVPVVLEALSKDRFITVLRMDMLTVDSGQAVLAGFVYGDKPVVQLNLSCEELFFRSDTFPYMPDSIRRALGIMPAPAGAPAPQ